MLRLLPLLLALLTLFIRSAPAHATERLAVLELTGKALTNDERATLTDTVRGSVVKALGGSVQVMTRENMEVMMADMGMDAACVSEGACEVETARNLGVDYVISGSVTSMSGTQVVSLKLLETRSGQMMASEQVRGANALTLMDALAGPSETLVASLAGGAATVRPPPVRGKPAVAGSDWVSPTLGAMKWIPGPAGTYWMMETEVTQAEWKAVTGEEPSGFPDCGGDCPVERVSFDDITAFLGKLSERDGVEYRLPTKDEWEFAAMGGEASAYAGSDDVNAIGWYGKNSGDATHPACGKERNGYGLCDMVGNVREWTSTKEAARGGQSLSQQMGLVAPPASNRLGLGSSWASSAKTVRLSDPASLPPDYRMFLVGFRLIRPAP